ncbi:type II toxin-antitoxin system RelE/ParE family toxin [Lacunimicrobium album]
MIYTVRLSPMAFKDFRKIVNWLIPRSQVGRKNWETAFYDLLSRLAQNADTNSEAEEEDRVQRGLKQAFFKTRHGKPYRVIYVIRPNNNVLILRPHSPGQRILRRRRDLGL